jgi:hypothetical protein
MELAERLGRTVDEVLHGGPSHRPMSSAELSEWKALWRLRAWEQEKASRSRSR